MLIFGSLYYVIECLFRGYSHWTMFIVAAISGWVIGQINKIISWETPLVKQGLIGMVIITLFEAISGYILNVKLGLDIWDYSNMPLNFFFRQCCLPFCLIWFVLAIVGVVLDDYLRFILFNEEYPHYKII